VVRNGLTVAAENHGHRIRPGPAMLTARVPAGRQPGRRQSGRTAASGWARPPRRSGPAAWALHVDLDHLHLPGEVTGGRSSAGSTRRHGAHHGDHIARVRRRGAPGDRDEAVVVGVDDLGQGAWGSGRSAGIRPRPPGASCCGRTSRTGPDVLAWASKCVPPAATRRFTADEDGLPRREGVRILNPVSAGPPCAEVAVTRAATADKLLVLVKRAQAEPYRLGGR
jgi:hypothetical protein